MEDWKGGMREEREMEDRKGGMREEREMEDWKGGRREEREARLHCAVDSPNMVPES